MCVEPVVEPVVESGHQLRKGKKKESGTRKTNYVALAPWPTLGILGISKDHTRWSPTYGKHSHQT